MVEKRMSVCGVGPGLMISTFLYSLLLAGIHRGHAEIFHITCIPSLALYAISAGLLVIGVVIWLLSSRTILLNFNKGILVTTGVYACARHPLYSAFILFIVPGIALLARSWLFLTVPVFMYIFFRLVIGREEEFLECEFGSQYLAYKQKTPALFFKFWHCRG